MRRTGATLAAALATLMLSAAGPAPAFAAGPGRLVCRGAGLVVSNPLGPSACHAIASGLGLIGRAGGQLLSGNVGGAVGTVVGAGVGSVAGGVLSDISNWVVDGARAALHATASLISRTTTPQLESVWFSSAYWRVAAVSALLTIPFLLAAAIQALLHADVTLLARAALGYLPLAALCVGVAAPVTMLLLAASDEMSTIVSSGSAQAGVSFLGQAAVLSGGLSELSPFLVCCIAMFTIAAAIVLWLELLVRDAAVYVIVLMLPLFFAAMVWPARRAWAGRAVELLVALILSKFAIVAVLALGGTALAHVSGSGVGALLAGLTLIVLSAFTPWAMLRLLPLHEVAGAAAGGLRQSATQPLTNARDRAYQATSVLGHLRRNGDSSGADAADDDASADASGADVVARTQPPGIEPPPAAGPAPGADQRPGVGAVAGGGLAEALEAARGGARASGGREDGAHAGGDLEPAVSEPAVSEPAVSEPAVSEPDTSAGAEPARGDGHLGARDLDGIEPLWRADWRELHLDLGFDADGTIDQPPRLPEVPPPTGDERGADV